MKLPTFWQIPSTSKMKGSTGWKNKIIRTPLEMGVGAIPKIGAIGEVILKTTEGVVLMIVDPPNNREVEVMTKSQYHSGTRVNPLKDHHPPREKPIPKTNPKDPPPKKNTKTKYSSHPM